MKKKFGILLTVLLIFSLALSGCSNDKSEAAKFVKGYYEQWIDQKMTPEITFDDYLSDKSKELLGLNRDDFVTNLNNSMDTLNIKYTEINILGEEKKEKDVYKIRRTFKTVSDIGDNKDTGFDYVIKENGKMRFLKYGVTEKIDHTVLPSKPNALNISMPRSFVGVDSLVISLDVDNTSESHYTIGYLGNGQVIVTTDQGEYTQDLPSSVSMFSGGTRLGEIQIDKAKGNIKKVQINNIYAIGDNLKPINVHNSFSVVVFDADENK